MKVERIELRRYRLPLDSPFRASWDPAPRQAFDVTLVRVEADGLVGVGAGDPMAGFAGNEHLFIGHDALEIERHARVLENLGFHYGRMWPLEVALWDLTAKARGEPLWRLLGGESGRVRVYASTGERLQAEERAAAAVRLRDAGFPAIKLRFHAHDIAEDVAVVRAVRDAVGDAMEIMVDTNQGWRMPWDTSDAWSIETAMRVVDELAELRVYWLEEPLHRHDYRGLARLRGYANERGVRIAGGEGAREMVELREYLAHGSLDVYQPDVAWSTGVLRAREIAKAVRESGAMYTPHTWGDGVVLLANLHVFAACADMKPGSAPFVEYGYDPPAWTPERRDFVLASSIVARDGFVELGDAAGLGAEVDWAAIEEFRV
jgi:L-alanine-DL-glutamate epimerase-like enolase superfamily enzyme